MGPPERGTGWNAASAPPGSLHGARGPHNFSRPTVLVLFQPSQVGPGHPLPSAPAAFACSLLVEANPCPRAHSFNMAAALAQELSQLSLNGASSLESLTAAAQKGVQAEPFLLAHLPALLKATADKVRPPTGRTTDWDAGEARGGRAARGAAMGWVSTRSTSRGLPPSLSAPRARLERLQRAGGRAFPPGGWASCWGADNSKCIPHAAGCRDPRRRRQGW